jgi:hypothetical protein
MNLGADKTATEVTRFLEKRGGWRDTDCTYRIGV